MDFNPYTCSDYCMSVLTYRDVFVSWVEWDRDVAIKYHGNLSAHGRGVNAFHMRSSHEA